MDLPLGLEQGYDLQRLGTDELYSRWLGDEKLLDLALARGHSVVLIVVQVAITILFTNADIAIIIYHPFLMVYVSPIHGD